jgi:hypothetical protein
MGIRNYRLFAPPLLFTKLKTKVYKNSGDITLRSKKKIVDITLRNKSNW